MDFETFVANLKKKHEAELEAKRAQIRADLAKVEITQRKVIFLFFSDLKVFSARQPNFDGGSDGIGKRRSLWQKEARID